MGLNFEKNITDAFGAFVFPLPKDFPPIRLEQEAGTQWRNFGNRASPLVEEAFLLYALVRMTKPKFVLDVGTWNGTSAIFMAEGLRDNGFGRIVTVEHHGVACDVAEEFFRQGDYPEIVLVNSHIEQYYPPEEIDFLFLDTELADRVNQFTQLLPSMSKDSWAAFHDAGGCPGIDTIKFPYLHFKTVREFRVFHIMKDDKKTDIPVLPKADAENPPLKMIKPGVYVDKNGHYLGTDKPPPATRWGPR